jgi:hypothetical protein
MAKVPESQLIIGTLVYYEMLFLLKATFGFCAQISAHLKTKINDLVLLKATCNYL